MGPMVTGSIWPGVRYFSTTRNGGVSRGDYASCNLGLHVGDHPDRVAENRRRLRQRLPADPYWLQQVHGMTVADADARTAPADGVPQADAAITTQAERVLAILTADCLPVVLGDVHGRVLGVAHAGWRGLAQGVLEQTLLCLRQRCPQAQGWRAWIGPAIGPQAFVVERDVLDAFVQLHPHAIACFRPGNTPGKWLADLPGLATLRLHAAGVTRVEWCGQCTFSDPQRYFSYRYRATTGRLATCAWRVTNFDAQQCGGGM